MKTYAIEVAREIREAINRVNRNCCKAKQISFQKHDVEERDLRGFKVEEQKLAEKISNRNDVRILLDSYYVKIEKLQVDSCFVTIDHDDIITNGTHIENYLKGLRVREPNEFNVIST